MNYPLFIPEHRPVSTPIGLSIIRGQIKQIKKSSDHEEVRR